MLDIQYEDGFVKNLAKIRDNQMKGKVKKQISKITNNPEVGKPMRYNRQGTREVYIGSFRLSYSYIKDKEKIIFLEPIPVDLLLSM